MSLDVLCGVVGGVIFLAAAAPFARFYDTVRERPESQGWGK
jgi:hypothetical protein